MSFWSSETLRTQLPNRGLVEPFNAQQVVSGAYELRMGAEAFITSSASRSKTLLHPGQQVIIPPGQLGLLLTEEVITIPPNAIGLTSTMRKLKRRIGFRGHGTRSSRPFLLWTKCYPWGSFLSHGKRPAQFADRLRRTAHDALRRDGVGPCVLPEARSEAAPPAVSPARPSVPRLPAGRLAAGAALRGHRGA